jgi:hypothetical protein
LTKSFNLCSNLSSNLTSQTPSHLSLSSSNLMQSLYLCSSCLSPSLVLSSFNLSPSLILSYDLFLSVLLDWHLYDTIKKIIRQN